MGDISKNFSRSEFECKCGCGFSVVDAELLQKLELLRSKFNKPIKINSGCRCALHNSAVGGSQSSKHKQGIAADISVKDTDPEDVYNFLDLHAPNKYGIGMYKSFTHIDIRKEKARWKG